MKIGRNIFPYQFPANNELTRPDSAGKFRSVGKIEYLTSSYDDGVLLSLNKTRKLGEVLSDLADSSLERFKEILGVAAHKDTMKRFLKDLQGSDVLDTNVKRIIGSGSVAIAFETDDGKVLKITDGNQFRMNRPVEDFDAPIYKKGKCGRTYYYLEEKCSSRGLTMEFVQMIREKIKEKGYRIYDLDEFDVHQIGLSKEGKLYLLDHECAKYKTVFHKIFDVLKRIKH